MGKRRVLVDIGNILTVGGVEGKLPEFSRPLTRGFYTLLLANAQADKNFKKPNAVNVDGNGAIPAKVPSQKNAENKVIVISPDTEEQQVKEKKSALSTRSKDEILLRMGPHAKAFIATLSSDRKDQILMVFRNIFKTAHKEATVKAACGLPKEHQIQDIDAGDADNELAVVEYVEDIYKFYKEAENERRVYDYMDSQPFFTNGTRAVLIDWLIAVHLQFKLPSEKLYLTINIIDRYLAVRSTSRWELALVGISSMVIASKYEEIWAPKVNEFVRNTDYTQQEVLEMEKRILGELEWYLTVPTPYVFLVRFIKAAAIEEDSDLDSAIMENMVYFLAELSMMCYAISAVYCPSMIAASAVYVARCTLKKSQSPAWTETLKLHTGFSEPQLMDCAKLLVKYHLKAATCKLHLFNKYSNTRKAAVAQLPPAKFLLAAC